MRRFALLSIPSIAAALALAACGGSSYSAGSSSPSPATKTTAAAGSAAVVSSAANPTLRTTVLTNASGLTIYRLSGEHAGHFICASSSCTQIWHPVSASASSAAASHIASLGVVTRPDGSSQVAYRGMPLYTFAQDQRPGDAKGQGLKDVGTWNAVTVSSAPGATPAASTTSESSAPASSGGYHY